MKDLTKGNVFKLILMFTFPIFLGSISGMVYFFVDGIIIGKSIGKEALAATGEVFTFIFVMSSIVTGIAMGGNILLSQYFGAKDNAMVSKIIETNILFLFFASLLVTFSGILLCPFVFELLNVPKEVMPYAVIYTRVYFSGMTFMFFTNTIQAMLRSMGDSKTPLYFIVATNALNILFDVIFVYWLKLGIYGVSFAVVLSYFIVFIGLFYYFNKYKKNLNVNIFKPKFDRDIFIRSFKIGIPIGMQTLILSIAMSSAFSIVNKFGTDSIAAYNAASKIETIMFMFAMDISMGFSSFAGQNIGANRFDRLKQGMASAWLICAIPVLLLTFISLFKGNFLISLFTNDKNVIELGTKYLLIVSGFYIICTTTYIIGSVFTGAGRTVLTLISTIIGWWLVRIPVSYYLGKAIGVDGVWWSISAQWITEFIFLLVIFSIGKWKDKINIQPISND